MKENEPITKKPDLKRELDACFLGNTDDLSKIVSQLEKRVLSRKIRFPLLEYAGEELYKVIPPQQQIAFCHLIKEKKTIGGNVLIGKILQLRSAQNLDESLKVASDIISEADIWYICDIIGERVYGETLWKQFGKTFPEIIKLATTYNNWVIRAMGAGIHYATKRGLRKEDSRELFRFLLTHASSKDKEIRQGIGWAAKTTAKFHPSIITEYKSMIEDTDKVHGWFRRKVEIGLKRNQYASGN